MYEISLQTYTTTLILEYEPKRGLSLIYITVLYFDWSIAIVIAIMINQYVTVRQKDTEIK